MQTLQETCFKIISDNRLKPIERKFLQLLLSFKEIKRVKFFNYFAEFDHMQPEAKDRMLRLMKQNLIKAGYPLGSSHERGYFFINSEKDLQDAIEEYKVKATSQYISAKQIEKNFTKFFNVSIKPVQFKLF